MTMPYAVLPDDTTERKCSRLFTFIFLNQLITNMLQLLLPESAIVADHKITYLTYFTPAYANFKPVTQ